MVLILRLRKRPAESSARTKDSLPCVSTADDGTVESFRFAALLMRMFANMSGFNNPPVFGTMQRTWIVRVVASTVGLIAEMRAGNVRSAYAGTVISTGAPTWIS